MQTSFLVVEVEYDPTVADLGTIADTCNEILQSAFLPGNPKLGDFIPSFITKFETNIFTGCPYWSELEMELPEHETHLDLVFPNGKKIKISMFHEDEVLQVEFPEPLDVSGNDWSQKQIEYVHIKLKPNL